jgi:hypothetical protein
MKRLPRTLRLSRQAFAADPGREMEAGDPGAVEGKAVALWRIAPADPRAERQSPDATAARSGSAGAYHPGQSRRCQGDGVLAHLDGGNAAPGADALYAWEERQPTYPRPRFATSPHGSYPDSSFYSHCNSIRLPKGGLRPHKGADDSSPLLRGDGRRVQGHRILPGVCGMAELRLGHPAASVSSFTLSCFEDFEGRPNPNNKRRARRERRKARTELRLVAQHEVENNVEVAFCDPSERRLQVLIVNLQRLMQLGLRPHVASSGHLDEGIQSDVKDWHVRTVL